MEARPLELPVDAIGKLNGITIATVATIAGMDPLSRARRKKPTAPNVKVGMLMVKMKAMVVGAATDVGGAGGRNRGH